MTDKQLTLWEIVKTSSEVAVTCYSLTRIHATSGGFTFLLTFGGVNLSVFGFPTECGYVLYLTVVLTCI
jgi:hypothetical protein